MEEPSVDPSLRARWAVVNGLAHVILLRMAGASFEQFGEAVKPFFLVPMQELDEFHAVLNGASDGALARPVGVRGAPGSLTQDSSVECCGCCVMVSGAATVRTGGDAGPTPVSTAARFPMMRFPSG